MIAHYQNRYPRVLRLMAFAACLSPTEAAACIRDFKAGSAFSGEAVNHYGGTRAVMDSVLRLRTNYAVRSLDRGNFWE
jgi:hypothetical protein